MNRDDAIRKYKLSPTMIDALTYRVEETGEDFAYTTATIICTTKTEQALIARGLMHPVQSHRTEAGIAVTQALVSTPSQAAEHVSESIAADAIRDNDLSAAMVRAITDAVYTNGDMTTAKIGTIVALINRGICTTKIAKTGYRNLLTPHGAAAASALTGIAVTAPQVTPVLPHGNCRHDVFDCFVQDGPEADVQHTAPAVVAHVTPEAAEAPEMHPFDPEYVNFWDRLAKYRLSYRLLDGLSYYINGQSDQQPSDEVENRLVTLGYVDWSTEANGTSTAYATDLGRQIWNDLNYSGSKSDNVNLAQPDNEDGKLLLAQAQEIERLKQENAGLRLTVDSAHRHVDKLIASSVAPQELAELKGRWGTLLNTIETREAERDRMARTVAGELAHDFSEWNGDEDRKAGPRADMPYTVKFFQTGQIDAHDMMCELRTEMISIGAEIATEYSGIHRPSDVAYLGWLNAYIMEQGNLSQDGWKLRDRGPQNGWGQVELYDLDADNADSLPAWADLTDPDDAACRAVIGGGWGIDPETCGDGVSRDQYYGSTSDEWMCDAHRLVAETTDMRDAYDL